MQTQMRNTMLSRFRTYLGGIVGTMPSYHKVTTSSSMWAVAHTETNLQSDLVRNVINFARILFIKWRFLIFNISQKMCSFLQPSKEINLPIPFDPNITDRQSNMEKRCMMGLRSRKFPICINFPSIFVLLRPPSPPWCMAVASFLQKLKSWRSEILSEVTSITTCNFIIFLDSNLGIIRSMNSRYSVFEKSLEHREEKETFLVLEYFSFSNINVFTSSDIWWKNYRKDFYILWQLRAREGCIVVLLKSKHDNMRLED